MVRTHKIAADYYELIDGRLAVLVYRLHNRWIAQAQWDNDIFSPLFTTRTAALLAGRQLIAQAQWELVPLPRRP